MSKMKTMKTKTRMNLVGWGFALPAVLGFLIFNLFPMLLSGYYSLCDYNIIGKPSWVGLKNLLKLEKKPAHAEPFMGIGEFTEIRDYCILCVVWQFLPI